MCEGCRAGSSPKMDRRNFLKLGGAGFAGAVLLGTAGGTALAQTGPSLAEQFRSAATEYDVPKELLLAMGHTNTLWEMPPPTASDYEPGDLHGRGAYGLMQLYQNPSRDTLGRAAGLTGLSEQALKNERAANVRGGAAVVSEMVGGTKPSGLDGWYEAVAEYGDTELYAQEVFQTLERGASTTISTGEGLRLAPQNVTVPAMVTALSSMDYRGATWRPAYGGNYSSGFNRESDININRLVVHVAQGTVAGTVSWFQDSRANVSAHYVVGDRGAVFQCVRHEDVAWHAGNWTWNKHSIGIEHGGYADNRSTWTDAKYRASAKLAAYCCRRHKIPVDREHVVGHVKVPGSTHYCPGKHFNYHRYLRLIRRFK
ncbi:MAG: N-acetylmuramoyl-L-alanine amidase [Actinomycetota bacterium]|nr:N-acetylmuramoyl-L-alanine amidase [Actinomycetota bacterium]